MATSVALLLTKLQEAAPLARFADSHQPTIVQAALMPLVRGAPTKIETITVGVDPESITDDVLGIFHSSQDRSIPAAAENDCLLLLEIDDCDCKDQDRAPANQQLFDVSIEHGTPPLERLPIRRSCHG
jgi:hypothetical protein